MSFPPYCLAWHAETGRRTDEPRPKAQGPFALHLHGWNSHTIHGQEKCPSRLSSFTLLSRPPAGMICPECFFLLHRRPALAQGSYENLAMTAAATPVDEIRAEGPIDADLPSG
ncbi:hypothetical protein LY76DRAFT_56276 [Colletotrichum caudatum]|nr:hypothetical protein LY76DRAFT_56276 [Colletotrichum caudatum]